MTQDGHLVLCHMPGSTSNYVFKRWDRNGILFMRESEYEVDQWLQSVTVSSNRYDLVVFKLTEDQVYRQLIRKIKGH
jgi:hypothetical protein